MFPTPTIIVLGNVSLASSLFEGVTSLLVGLLLIGAAAILLAVVRLFHIFEVSRFSAVLLLILAAIPLTVSVFNQRTGYIGRAGPEVAVATVQTIDVGTNSVTLTIVTTKPAIISVRIGTSVQQLSRTAIENTPEPPKRTHTVAVQALESRTTYWYQILVNGQPSGALGSFATK